MWYKLYNEIGDYVDKTSGADRNMLETTTADTPSGPNIGWDEFSAKTEAMLYFNIKYKPEEEKCDGNYVIGRQSDWVNLANKMNLNVDKLLLRAYRSIRKPSGMGEYLWDIEMWELTFSEMLWVWGHNMIIMEEYQEQQLGIGVKDIKDKDGDRIFNNDLSIVTGQEEELIKWCRLFVPEMPFNLTQAQEITYINNNNVKNKIKTLFDAFKSS